MAGRPDTWSGTVHDSSYWTERYRSGGNSGSGSAGRNLAFKANFVRDFLVKHQLREVLDIGCGNGGIIPSLPEINYHGIDFAKPAIDYCQAKWGETGSRKFTHVTEVQGNSASAEVVLVLEVLMHITDDKDYERFLRACLSMAEKFVVLQTPLKADLGKRQKPAPHERYRDIFLSLIPHYGDFEVFQIQLAPGMSIADREAGIVGSLASDFVVLRRK